MLLPPGAYPGPIAADVEGDSEGNDVLLNFDDEADEDVTIISEDYDVLLQELEESRITMEKVQDFFVNQVAAKLRTWKANKDLKRASQVERGYNTCRVARLAEGGRKANRAPFL